MDKLSIFNFSDYQVPEFKEVHGEQWVKYGTDNKYPDYLLSLYQKSPKHNAIINSKAVYIVGKGFEGNLPDANQFGESVNKILKKQVLDIEIHGGTYIQIIWDKGGSKITDVIHLDNHKVRSSKDNTKFYYREQGWVSFVKPDDYQTFPAFNLNKPKGSQIIYYKEYRPGLNTYTLPNYIGSLNYIEADMLISEHVLNNSKSGFTPSKLITLFGDPTEEQKRMIERGFAEKYTGKKGSKFIMQWVKRAEEKSLIEDLGQSDMSKEQFGPIDDLIQQNIFAGHQITSPSLFGIKTEGQLGGSTELRTAYEIFKNTYVNARQQNLEELWSMLLPYLGFKKATKIIPVEPVGIDILTNPSLLNMVPEKYIMDKLGIDPTEYPPDPKQPAPAPADQAPADQKEPTTPADKKQKFEDDSLIALFSEMGSPKDHFQVLKTKRTVFSAEDVDYVEQLAFAEISQNESNILNLVSKDKRITPQALADALKLPIPFVEKLLAGLEEKGLLSSKSEKVGEDTQTERTLTEEAPKVQQEVRPITTEIFIKYSYEGPKDDRNRDFCRRLLDLDRFYSRSDIETISQRVGYSVWERRGGFYHNPQTDLTTPYCRHKWIQNILIKKNG